MHLYVTVHTYKYVYLCDCTREVCLDVHCPLPLCWKASFLRTGPQATAVASVPTTVPGTEELFCRELLNECIE